MFSVRVQIHFPYLQCGKADDYTVLNSKDVEGQMVTAHPLAKSFRGLFNRVSLDGSAPFLIQPSSNNRNRIRSVCEKLILHLFFLPTVIWTAHQTCWQVLLQAETGPIS
jgi:hypothetical protein